MGGILEWGPGGSGGMALGKESSVSFSGSIIVLFCDPWRVASLLWASVLPPVEWEAETREGKPLALSYSARQ